MNPPDAPPALPPVPTSPADAFVATAPWPEAVRPLVEAPQGFLRRAADRMTDALNPILVREVRQALGGKAFVVTAALTFLATVLIGLGVAWRGQDATGMGAQVFSTALQVLSVIVIFIVPLQAFISMRHEVTHGTVEHLLMSRLTPGQIVRGKLAAAIVLFVLFLSIFAPLMAMTFLLRGVDVPTIAYLIVMAFLGGVAASALAVACGALSRWPALFRIIPLGIVLFGLGGTAFGLVGGIEVLTPQIASAFGGPEFWWATWSFVGALAAGTLLFGMIGAAALAHPYANRSTGFRIFALIGAAAGYAWLWMMSASAGTSFARRLDGDEVWFYAIGLALALAVFPLLASTEDPPLNPRVRTQVPRNALLAFLSIPLLPGAGRGLLFTMLLAAVAMGGAALVVGTLGFSAPTMDTVHTAWMSWLYLLFYAGIAAFVRSRLGRGGRANWMARGVPIVVLLLAIFVPLLFEAFADNVYNHPWQPYDILNPFETLDGTPSTSVRTTQIALLGGLTTVAVGLLCGPLIVRSIREVFQASRAKRHGAAR